MISIEQKPCSSNNRTMVPRAKIWFLREQNHAPLRSKNLASPGAEVMLPMKQELPMNGEQSRAPQGAGTMLLRMESRSHAP